MDTDDREFARAHAYRWALRCWLDEDTANAYAAWYDREYGEWSIKDMPAHPTVRSRFEAHRLAAAIH